MIIPDERCISREQCVEEEGDDDGQAFEEIIRRRGRRKTITRVESATATEIYSLLDLISTNAMKLKPQAPRLRIIDFTASEVKIHMDEMYIQVTSLLRTMEKVHRDTARTYYEHGLKAIFKWFDQLCTRLDQIGYLNYDRTNLEIPILVGRCY